MIEHLVVFAAPMRAGKTTLIRQMMANRLQELSGPLGIDDPDEWLYFSKPANIKLPVPEVKIRVFLECPTGPDNPKKTAL